MAAKRTSETRVGYRMRAKECRPCHGTGIGRFTRNGTVACVHCLGYGKVVYAERVSAPRVRA